MAGYLQPKKPKGITSVAAGGAYGRAPTLHMGTGGTANGGANPKGSPKRTNPAIRPVPTRPVYPGHHAGPMIGATKGMAHPASFATAGLVTPPAVVTPPAATIAAAPVAAPAAPAVVAPDYSLDANYVNSKDALDAAHNQAIAGFTKQLADLPAQYDASNADLKKWQDQDTWNNNANLAQRGVFSSGQRDNDFADRAATTAAKTQAIEAAYGSGARATITGNIESENGQYKLGMDAADRTAAANWQLAHPPAPEDPLGGLVTPPIVAAPPTPKKAPVKAKAPVKKKTPPKNIFAGATKGKA